MKITIAAPGKLNHPGAVAWSDDLYARIGRILPIQRRAGREVRRSKSGVDDAAKRAESQALLLLMPPNAFAVALDLGGAIMDSDRFYSWLIGLAESGTRDLCFFIGGPDGHDAALLDVCRAKLALSTMVLPHEMAEVVLLEQTYRALTRWKGLPYHR